jgi:hypothetical protein
MAVLGRGKKYSDEPGWALDPKTKLELKRRKEAREAPSKHGGKIYPKDESESMENESVEKKEKEERRKKKSREVVTSENREEYMAKKLKLANKQEPVYKEE